MPRSLLRDRHRQESASLRPSPGPCPATAHRPAAECCALRAKTHRPSRDQNFRLCCPGTGPADAPANRALSPQPVARRDTSARTRPRSPDQSAQALFRKPRAPTAKSRSDSKTSAAVATAPPAPTASFSPCRCPAPPPKSEAAFAPRYPWRASRGAAHPRASARTPAVRRSSRTARNRLRRRDSSTAVLSGRLSRVRLEPRPRIRTHVEREGNRSACLLPRLTAALVFDATKRRVDKWIVWLEPVTKRTSQHAGSRAGRATLHYVVLTIKKISRISWIKGHRLKSGKGLEHRASPFPSVADDVVYSERACSARVRSHRTWIPMLKIKIAVFLAGCLIAPGIIALKAVFRRAVSRAMELLFARQFTSEPFRISRRFRVAHIHRPIERQLDVAKHRAIHPQISFAPPERRMLDSGLVLPLPSSLVPQRAILVSAGSHELQEVAIHHVISVDRKSRNEGFQPVKFVVPTKLRVVSALQPKRRRSRGNIDQVRFRARRFPHRFLRRSNFPICRLLMQHVRQRLRMHQPMLDRNFDHREQQRMPFRRIGKRSRDRPIQFIAQSLVVRIDLFALRPVRRLIARQSSADWVDSKRKQLIECLVKRLQPERPLRQQIPVERFDVPNVKNDAMPLRDRTVVQRLFTHDLEQVVGALAGFSESEV